jgi:archaellum biogenesis ATPase FlaH
VSELNKKNGNNQSNTNFISVGLSPSFRYEKSQLNEKKTNKLATLWQHSLACIDSPDIKIFFNLKWPTSTIVTNTKTISKKKKTILQAWHQDANERQIINFC